MTQIIPQLSPRNFAGTANLQREKHNEKQAAFSASTVSELSQRLDLCHNILLLNRYLILSNFSFDKKFQRNEKNRKEKRKIERKRRPQAAVAAAWANSELSFAFSATKVVMSGCWQGRGRQGRWGGSRRAVGSRRGPRICLHYIFMYIFQLVHIF